MEKLTRRQARENAFIAMFEASFGGDIQDIVALSREEGAEHAVDAFGEELLFLYGQNSKQVNEAIESKLKGWKVNRLARVNLALLRLAVTEMRFGQQGMESVVINETVELAKKYADSEDYQFVNGVLGILAREHDGNDNNDEQEQPPALGLE
ncbi:MAG: transcription antitermination factor NusB [Oscillospiraceae bacterium]